MASNILTSDINELYPVAGADNDSQGVRDNFRLSCFLFFIGSSIVTFLLTSCIKSLSDETMMVSISSFFAKLT